MGQHYFLGLHLGVHEPPLDVQAAPKVSLHRGSISGAQMAKMAPEAAPRSLFAATEKERALLVNSLTRTQTPSGKPESPLKHAVIAPDVIHFNFSESKRFSSSSALLDSFYLFILFWSSCSSRNCEVEIKVLVQNCSAHKQVEFSIEFLPPADLVLAAPSPTAPSQQAANPLVQKRFVVVLFSSMTWLTKSILVFFFVFSSSK